MKKFTIMIIPSSTSSIKQISVPKFIMNILILFGFLGIGLSGYFVFDYLELRKNRQSYYGMAAENEGLKGEARILANNLEDVKKSLRQLKDYTEKLGELTSVKVQKVSKQTGIGPLTAKEYIQAQKQPVAMKTEDNLPFGLNLDKLVFRPVFDRLTNIGTEANQNVYELQQLISTLSQQKSLLSAIPSISPVNGWIASGFGSRISPFSGEQAFHMGLDIAAPIGSPIFAPADGVVIFVGAKAGFGNFIMVAHGYGIVTCYGHNAQNLVQPGQQLQRGEQIATVGATGRTTGPHLHYEIWTNGRAINPRNSVLSWNSNLLY